MSIGLNSHKDFKVMSNSDLKVLSIPSETNTGARAISWKSMLDIQGSELTG